MGKLNVFYNWFLPDYIAIGVLSKLVLDNTPIAIHNYIKNVHWHAQICLGHLHWLK